MLTLTDVYYPGQIFRPEYNATVKPSLDNALTLRKAGGRLLGLPTGTNKSVNLAHLFGAISARIAMLTMPANKVVVLQYPYQSRIKPLFETARKRGNKIILLCHDIDQLRFGKDPLNDLLGKADILIVHTPAMKEWVEKNYPGKKCVVLGIFDYLCDFNPKECREENEDGKRHVVFAGNLVKSGFLAEISNIPSWLQYDVLGLRLPAEIRLPEGVVHRGAVPPEELPFEICNADFGLVWDGPSADCCSGEYGEYLRYNAPYKASSYIASGLPVIVWDKMGLADFVLKEGVGIAVGSLDEIPERLKAITPKEYEVMQDRVLEMQKRIKSGYFFMKAVEEALAIINHSE